MCSGQWSAGLCRSELTKPVKVLICKGVEMGSNMVIKRVIPGLDKGRAQNDQQAIHS